MPSGGLPRGRIYLLLGRTCLGSDHGRRLDEDRVLAALRRHVHDPEIGGSVGDALDDIDTFIVRHRLAR